jgi:hypothetical protein
MGLPSGITPEYFPVRKKKQFIRRIRIFISIGQCRIFSPGSSVLFHGEDFDHVVGVIPHLCLAEPGNAEVTFAVNIGKIF